MSELIALILLAGLLRLSIFLRKRKSEYSKAFDDAVLYGRGYLVIFPDGKFKHIPARKLLK